MESLLEVISKCIGGRMCVNLIPEKIALSAICHDKITSGIYTREVGFVFIP